MEKKFDVTALGELLIDFTENGISPQGNPVLEANPGGAVCNVLAMLNKLGHNTGFIGKVGDDMFGEQLVRALQEVHISTEGLVKDREVPTTLAFVHTLPGGDRDFSFYRNPGADMMIGEEEVNVSMVENSRIFHFGSLSMTDERCRQATRYGVELAKKSGALISFDPNLRPPLWKDLNEAKEQIEFGIRQCDILKISDNEIQWFTGEEDFKKAAGILLEKYDIKLLLLSMGNEGSMAFQGETNVFVPAFLQRDTIETTGAGDTFCGCVLHYVLEHGFREYEEAELKSMLAFANAAASLVTTRKGALRVMPEREEILKILERSLSD